MNVTFVVRVPIDIAAKIGSRLEVIRKLHTEEVDQLTKKLKAVSTERTAKRHADLVERGRRLTPHHLLRLALANGIGSLDKLSDDVLLSRIGEDALVRGRPRGT